MDSFHRRLFASWIIGENGCDSRSQCYQVLLNEEVRRLLLLHTRSITCYFWNAELSLWFFGDEVGSHVCYQGYICSTLEY